jgi:hypothetical protein
MTSSGKKLVQNGVTLKKKLPESFTPTSYYDKLQKGKVV